ncbi:transglycosylase domain-containing protein [Streptomyces pathocidini]|uniref:transglycosylase domain-containing protein n=1 Tax=Streptomyces pathocidini TaxID=1650571 RepID=UPI0034073281
MGRPRAKRAGGGIRRFFTWRKVLGAVLTMGVLGIGTFIALYIAVDVPDANADAKKQANVFMYDDGSILARAGSVNREIVPLSQVPKAVQHAFVAAENKTFYQDSGVDLKGTARGLVNTALGRGKQGGSTITQQYVKNYFLDQEQTVSRKAKELIISLKVDQEMSKDDILAGYMNTSYYGRGAYGIQAAARAYYGVDARDLTVEQGAYLAALLQAPSQYEWSGASETSRKLALQRWNYVLDNMVGMDWLDAGARSRMDFDTPIAPKPPAGLDGQAGYLAKLAQDELAAAGVDKAEFDAGGWQIKLAIDKKKQRALEAAVDDKLRTDLDPEKRKVDSHVQPGAVSVDPKTGRIVAMYGGESATKHYTNNATRRDYQPASTFKPLILAAALENSSKTQSGAPIKASTVYDGTSKRPVKGSTIPFAPENEDDRNYGPISVQKAMNKSVNSVFAQMAVDVGLDKVKQTAINLGMSEKAGGFEAKPAMSLGSMGGSPLDMAAAYATLDNHGKKVTPRLVLSAERGDQKVDLPEEQEGEQVVDRTTADTVTSVLAGVVDDGTGAVVRSAGLDIAGKTGTSDDNKSAWFAGYTPELVTTVGLFGEDAEEGGKQVTLYGTGGGGRVNGSGYPAQIWADYTRAALKGESSAEFDLDTDQGAAITLPSTTPTAPPTRPGRGPDPTHSTPGGQDPSDPESPTDPPTDPGRPTTPTIPPTDPVTPTAPPTKPTTPTPSDPAEEDDPNTGHNG